VRKAFYFLLLLFAALGGLIFYARGPAFSPREFPPSAIVKFSEPPAGAMPPQQIKVVTYNIGYGSGIKNNKDAAGRDEVEKNLAEIAEVLRRLNPDVLALQEVDFRSHRSFDVDQFQYLAKALDMPYGAYTVTWNKRYLPWPYWPPRLHFGRLLSGQAVLSRFPIEAQETRVLAKPKSNAFWYNWFYLDRILQRLVLKIGDREAAFWNVHLEAFDSETRLSQAHILAEWVRGDSHVLKWAAGDFNSVSVHRLDLTPEEKGGLEDNGESLRAFAEAAGMTIDPPDPRALSMPSWKPYKKLDHILYAGPLRLLASGSESGVLGSDHLPVWATFELR
jgi:endonuclease/exonuclease/phosphatase family metal-dependent hydrolase